MRKHSLLMVTILLLSLTTTLALAEPQGRGDKQGQDDRHAMRFEKMKQTLQLTEEQTQEIEPLVKSHRAKTAPLREQSRNVRQELRKLSQAETFDQDRANQLAQTQATLKVELTEARNSMVQEVSAILTPEQRAQWEELRKEARKP